MPKETQNRPRRGPMRMGFEKPKDFKGTLKRLLFYLKVYKVSIFFVILFSIASAIFSIVGPKIMGKATTEIFNGLIGKIIGTTAGIDFAKISGILLTLLALYILSMLFAYIQSFIMAGSNQRLAFSLREKLSYKMHQLPLAYYEKKTTGEILSRITNDVDTLSQSLDQSLTQVISSITMMIGVIVMMLSISPLMTLVAFLIIPLALFLMALVMSGSQKYFKRQQEYLGHINGQVEEIYTGHEIVTLFNQQEEALETFQKTNEVLYKSAWKSQFFAGMMHPIMMFIGNIGYVAISMACHSKTN